MAAVWVLVWLVLSGFYNQFFQLCEGKKYFVQTDLMWEESAQQRKISSFTRFGSLLNRIYFIYA